MGFRKPQQHTRLTYQGTPVPPYYFAAYRLWVIRLSRERTCRTQVYAAMSTKQFPTERLVSPGYSLDARLGGLLNAMMSGEQHRNHKTKRRSHLARPRATRQVGNAHVRTAGNMCVVLQTSQGLCHAHARIHGPKRCVILTNVLSECHLVSPAAILPLLQDVFSCPRAHRLDVPVRSRLRGRAAVKRTAREDKGDRIVASVIQGKIPFLYFCDRHRGVPPTWRKDCNRSTSK